MFECQLNTFRGSLQLQSSSRLLGLMWPSRFWVALSVLLGVLTIGSGIGLLATSAWLLSAAALQPSIADLGLAIVGVRFFGVTRAVFRYLERLASHSVTFRLLALLRTWFYASIEPLVPAGLTIHRSGDLLGRSISDVEALKEFYIRVVGPFLVAAIVALAIFIFFALFELILAVAVLPLLLLALLGLPAIFLYASSRGRQRSVHLRAELQANLFDALQGMADLTAFGQEGAVAKQLLRLSHDVTECQRRLSWMNGLQAGSSLLLTNMSMWIALLLAILFVGSGRLNGIYLASIALAILAAFEAFQPLPAAAYHLEGSLEAARRLFAIADTRPVVTDPKPPASPPLGVDLRIQDLRFRYGLEDPWVLDKINLHISPGKWVAIVGPSGAGKSTLANLLFRFWDYQAGQVLLDGRDLRSYAQENVRQMIGIVAQDSHVFHSTLRENILIARPKANPKEIVAAINLAQLDDFIKSLALGFETPVGEMGGQLSGGQRQRIIIARAILRDAPLLILDEPTANLDPITERQLLDTIFTLAYGRSLLLMTHRLVGMEQMDEILVLDAGQIVERGSHEQLLKDEGLYARLWKLQNRPTPELINSRPVGCG